MKTTNALFGIFAISLALSAQIQAQSFLTNGLVAYYPFNGDFSDASGNENDGEVVGDDWQFRYRFGTTSALYLNTNNPASHSEGTYVAATTSLDFNQDFTLSVWVNITKGLPAYHVHNLISDGIDQTSANFRLISAFDGTNDYLQFVGGVSYAEFVDIHAVVPPLRNTWWQAVVVRSGTKLSLYQNATLVTVTNSTAKLLNFTNIWLGGMSTNGGGEYPLDGGLDDVRVYNRALSPLEVQQLCAIEFPTGVVIPDTINGLVNTTTTLNIALTATIQLPSKTRGSESNITTSTTTTATFNSAKILELIATRLGSPFPGESYLVQQGGSVQVTNKTGESTNLSSYITINNSFGAFVASGTANASTGQQNASGRAYTRIKFNDGNGNAFEVDGLLSEIVSLTGRNAKGTQTQTGIFSGTVVGYGTVVDSEGRIDPAIFSGTVSGGGKGPAEP